MARYRKLLVLPSNLANEIASRVANGRVFLECQLLLDLIMVVHDLLRSKDVYLVLPLLPVSQKSLNVEPEYWKL